MLVISIATSVIALVVVVLQIMLLRRNTSVDLSPLDARFDFLEKGLQRIETSLREEMTQNARALREEVAASAKAHNDSVINGMLEIGKGQQRQLQSVIDTSSLASKQLREEVQGQMAQLGQTQKGQLDSFQTQLTKLIETNQSRFEDLRKSFETGMTF